MMEKKKYCNLKIKVIYTNNLDILTESGDGGIDFEGQEGWSLGAFGKDSIIKD